LFWDAFWVRLNSSGALLHAPPPPMKATKHGSGMFSSSRSSYAVCEGQRHLQQGKQRTNNS